MTFKPRQGEGQAARTATVRSRQSGETHSLALIPSVAQAKGRRRAADAAPAKAGLFSAEQIASLEAQYSDGLTAVQIVELFTGRGIRFSEATFRKYVQLGLVPRSRRIGRKGKHRGSLGVYPAKAIRRINDVRQLMDSGLTIEEIQGDLLRFADAMESLEEGVIELFVRLDSELESPRFDTKTRSNLRQEMQEARRGADELLKRLDGLTQKVGRSASDEFGGTGAAGSAEELL